MLMAKKSSNLSKPGHTSNAVFFLICHHVLEYNNNCHNCIDSLLMGDLNLAL